MRACLGVGGYGRVREGSLEWERSVLERYRVRNSKHISCLVACACLHLSISRYPIQSNPIQSNIEAIDTCKHGDTISITCGGDSPVFAERYPDGPLAALVVHDLDGKRRHELARDPQRLRPRCRRSGPPTQTPSTHRSRCRVRARRGRKGGAYASGRV